MKKNILVLVFGLIIFSFVIGIFIGKQINNTDYIEKNNKNVNKSFNKNFNKKISNINEEKNVDNERLKSIISNNFEKNENKTFINNMDYFFKKGRNIYSLDEAFLYSFGTIIFQIIEDKDTCNKLSSSLNNFINKEFFNMDCNFIYYQKKLLENKGEIEVPKEYLQKYNILGFIKNKKCNYQENVYCMLLFDNISRENFKIEGKKFMEDNNIDAYLRPYDSGFFIFKNDLSSLKNVDDIFDVMYDEALVMKAFYKKDKEVCNEILNSSNKEYCFDLFSEKSKQKYEEIFKDFFVKN